MLYIVIQNPIWGTYYSEPNMVYIVFRTEYGVHSNQNLLWCCEHGGIRAFSGHDYYSGVPVMVAVCTIYLHRYRYIGCAWQRRRSSNPIDKPNHNDYLTLQLLQSRFGDELLRI